MKTRTTQCRGFSLVELFAVMAIVALLVAVLVPSLARAKRRAGTIHCVSYLVQIDIASRIWQGDHRNELPMDVPVSLGGVKELVATGNVAAYFQVMSNELGTPFILACPRDFGNHPAANWNGPLTRSNISYFIGLTSTNPASAAVLVGDDNLVQNNRPILSGVVDLENGSVSWTRARHGGVFGMGNVSLVDGSVRCVSQLGLVSAEGTCFATNRLVIP